MIKEGRTWFDTSVEVQFEYRPGYGPSDDDPGCPPEIQRWWLVIGGCTVSGPFTKQFEDEIDHDILEYLSENPDAGE